MFPARALRHHLEKLIEFQLENYISFYDFIMKSECNIQSTSFFKRNLILIPKKLLMSKCVISNLEISWTHI